MEIQKIYQLIEANWSEFLTFLDEIIQIPSVKGTPTTTAPFGTAPLAALTAVLKQAESYGFKTNCVESAVGYAQYGDNNEYIGILGHLDVVADGNGWDYPSFKLTQDKGKLWGRGVLDNKGPILACLFGLKLLKDQGITFNRTIRILFGTDEESGSQDIPLYLNQECPPVFGFTPDCKFPVVYGERGVVNIELITAFKDSQLDSLSVVSGNQAKDHVPDQLSVNVGKQKIQVTGKRSPSNAPELGINGITLLAKEISQLKEIEPAIQEYFAWLTTSFHEQHFGEGLGIEFQDKFSGKLILTPYKLQKKQNKLTLEVAIRYPVSYNEADILTAIGDHLPEQTKIKVIRSMPSVLFDTNCPEVEKLSQAYEEVTKLDSTPVTTTGATYARSMPNIVAFGPSFPGQKGIAHNKNEYMNETDLKTIMAIYMKAMLNLLEPK